MSANDVDDVVNEVWIKAHQCDIDFESESKFAGWCRTAGRNHWLDLQKKRAREQLGEVPEQAVRADVVEEVHAKLFGDAIAAGIRDLKADQAEAIVRGRYSNDRERGALSRAQQNLRGIRNRFVPAGITLRLRAAGVTRWFQSHTPLAAAAAAAAGIAASAGIAEAAHVMGRHETPAVSAPHPSHASTRVRHELLRVDVTATASPASALAKPSARASRKTLVPLGRDANGQPQGVEYGPGDPKDRGVLYCGGITPVTGPFCVYYPEVVLKAVGH